MREKPLSWPPPSPPPHPRSRGVRAQGLGKCCLVPSGGPRRCPLRSTWNGGWGEGRGGAFCQAVAPPQGCPSGCRGRRGCCERPGRECRVSVWCPGPLGRVCLELENLVPDRLSIKPQDVLLPLPLPPPTAASELVPTLCRPTLSPTGVPSLWLSPNGGGGKGTGR